MLGEVLLCVYACICMRWGVFGWGNLHGIDAQHTPRCHTVVKAMSQPFVRAVQWQTVSSKRVQQITQFHRDCWAA